MSNRQIHNLTPISNSIDSADLFVVVDKSKLTTNTVPLRALSDAIDGTIFLSSSYAVTSSFTSGNTPSCSLATNVSMSVYTLNVSNSIALSCSYAHTSDHCYTNFDLFEITSSDDSLNIYTIPNAAGTILIKPRHPFASSYVLKPLSHSDIIGSRIISSSLSCSYMGLPANLYEFEVSKLDSSDRIVKFGVKLEYNSSPVTRYSEFRYFSSGGAQYAQGNGVFSISSSFSISTSGSLSLGSVVSSSTANFSENTSRIGTTAFSASTSTSASFSQTSQQSDNSSNGPLPGMILLYAGVSVSGSDQWYNCDGSTYITSYTELSTSLQSKFTDGVTSNRLPHLTTNSSSGIGPHNKQIYVEGGIPPILGNPNNKQISQSYGMGGNITGSYSTGIISGSQIESPAAFYYNIKR